MREMRDWELEMDFEMFETNREKVKQLDRELTKIDGIEAKRVLKQIKEQRKK